LKCGEEKIKKYIFISFVICYVVANACHAQEKRFSEYAPGEVLVKFREDVSRSSKASLHERIGARVLKRFDRIYVDLVKIPEGWTVEKAIEVYQADPDVECAEPNYIMKIQVEQEIYE
jgi:hypothetical protein